MRVTLNWHDYELIDATEKNRLERWGDVILVRPDPQVLWKCEKKSDKWNKADAVYTRAQTGGGQWEHRRKIREKWTIEYAGLKMIVSPTGFKHTGVFPEQAVNWDAYAAMIKKENERRKQPVRALNLFGYTGGATLALANAGAHVCHVDASKGMVAWARENAAENSFENKPIRWIVDDCAKFVAREIRRGQKYDALIMDPPSYGRGPGGEIWKIEDNIYELINMCVEVLSDEPLFVAVNSYTAGLSPSVMDYMLHSRIKSVHGGKTSCDEIGLKVTCTGGVVPCGATAFWLAESANLP